VKYYRTKNGVVSKIYGKQRERSREKNYPMPSYTNHDLREWLFGQQLFHRLYSEWKESGYLKELAPSLDRRNDYKPYTFDNIRLTTWKVNKAKGESDRKNGINNKVNKAVLQFTRKDKFIAEFHSSMEAQRQTGIYSSNIGHTCRNERKTAGGFIWRFKKEKIDIGQIH